VPATGWIAARLVAPLAGWNRRIRDNLSHVCPELSEAEVRRIVRAVPDNAGRTLIEMYSGAEFAARAADTPISGPGAEPLVDAIEAGGPILLVTGHYGNYLVPRAALGEARRAAWRALPADEQRPSSTNIMPPRWPMRRRRSSRPPAAASSR
jgi:Kdo2-lipid IVA lauroyltransferase/acyltransferase